MVQRQRSHTQAGHHGFRQEFTCCVVNRRKSSIDQGATPLRLSRCVTQVPISHRILIMSRLMQSILAEFAPERIAPVADTAASTNQSHDNSCTKCGGVDHWQPHGTDDWYCIKCQPPPAQSMIAHRRGVPTITMSVAYAVGHGSRVTASVGGNRIQFKSFRTRSICTCGSHMVVEHTWSDGLATFECASCAAGIAAHLVQGKS